MKAFTIIRVSAQDQLKGYGPEVQWEDDVLLNAPSLGLEPSVEYRRIIQERATDWGRELFERAVREGLVLYHKGEVEAMLFARVDRETRFVFGSVGLLAEVLRNGMLVFFARERFRLDPSDPQSVESYLNKAIQAQAYVATMRENTMRATRKRAEKDHRMPTGGDKWAYQYHRYRNYQTPDANSGQYTLNAQRGAWLCELKDWVLSGELSLKKCEKQFEELTGIRLSRATLWRILTDPIVIGKVYAYRHRVVIGDRGEKCRVRVPEEEWLLVYEDPSLRIFTDEEYYALKRKFRLNKQNSSRNMRHHYPPLRGVVYCQLCQRRMGSMTTNCGTAYYRCPSCRSLINAWRLWRDIKEYLTRLVLDPKRLVEIIKTNFDDGQNIKRLEQELGNLEGEKGDWEQSRVKQRRLYLLPNSNYSEQDYLQDDQRMQSRLKKIDDRIAQVEQQIAQAREAKLDEQGIRYFCEVAANNLDQMTDSQWRSLLEAIALKAKIVGKAVFIEGAVPVSNRDIALQSARRWWCRCPLL